MNLGSKSTTRPSQHASVAIMLAAMIWISPEANAKAAQDDNVQRASQYNTLITMIRRRENESYKTELVMLSLPKPGAEDQAVKRRVLANGRFGVYGFQPIGVYGGHLMALKTHHLIALDLQTDEERLVRSGLWYAPIQMANDRIYALAFAQGKNGKQARKLIEVDLTTQKSRDLYVMDWGHTNRVALAVSPSGEKIAVTEMLHVKDQPFPTHSRVVVVDLTSGKASPIDAKIPCTLYLTGGGDHHLAPTISWMDEQTIVVASEKPQREDSSFLLTGGPLELSLIKLATGKVETLCDLPRWQRQMHEPTFHDGASNNKLISLGKLGNYRIDLKSKSVVEDNRVGNGLALRGPANSSELWRGDEQLAKTTAHNRVFVSPDGDFAWLPTETIRGGAIIPNHDMALSVLGPKRKQQEVAKGWFARLPYSPRPQSPMCLWVSDDSLKKSDGLAKLPMLQEPKRVSTDSRPKVPEFARVKLKTDKAKYREHEIVNVSVTVENLLDKPITFPTPSPNRWGRPIELKLRSPRSNSLIDDFDNGWKEPEDGTIEIPGKAVRIYTRGIEAYGIGKHTLALEFHHNHWSGHIRQKVDFEIAKSDDEASLLKPKFDRLVSRCRTEFDKEPRSCQASRIWGLKAAAASLLVTFFKEHPDEIEFRKAMARGLEGIADESTLPYLEELINSDLKHDGKMAVDTCLSLYRRSKYYGKPVYKAIDLLELAGRHQNVEVRRRAISAVRIMTDTAITKLMKQASTDVDVGIATMASRYVAAQENRSLAEWFENASRDPTASRLHAARSIVSEIKQTFDDPVSRIPTGSFSDILANAEKLRQLKHSYDKLAEWARKNDRFSKQFFDKERAEAKKVIGRVAAAGLPRTTDKSEQ